MKNERKGPGEAAEAPKPDGLLAIAARRLKDGSYSAFLVRRIEGKVVEEQWGRPADSHLIVADRITDAVLTFGADMVRSS